MLTLGFRGRLKLIELIIISLFLLSQNTQVFSVSANPVQGVEGTLVILTGKDWPPNESVSIYWPNTKLEQDVITDKSGSFTVTIVVPKGTPLGTHNINVYHKVENGSVDLLLTAAPFTVLDKEPVECLDAYFIGLHGTAEGPDGPNQRLSQVVGETWENFYNLATESGKKVKGYAIDYWGDIWEVLATSTLPLGAVDQGKSELIQRIMSIDESCLIPRIVLMGYSLGAWVIDSWLNELESSTLWPLINWSHIRAVELYGDPLWERTGAPYPAGTVDTYKGVARIIADALYHFFIDSSIIYFKQPSVLSSKQKE